LVLGPQLLRGLVSEQVNHLLVDLFTTVVQHEVEVHGISHRVFSLEQTIVVQLLLDHLVELGIDLLTLGFKTLLDLFKLLLLLVHSHGESFVPWLKVGHIGHHFLLGEGLSLLTIDLDFVFPFILFLDSLESWSELSLGVSGAPFIRLL